MHTFGYTAAILFILAASMVLTRLDTRRSDACDD